VAEETHEERVNRELIELLNELRVALPGVQVLFAFLLAVPFAQGFAQTTSFQRDLFFAIMSATAISTVLFIAPTAWHRLNFRQHDKERMLLASNAFAIGGLGFLALAITGAMMLIADYVFSTSLTVIVGVVGALLFGLFWAVLPLSSRGLGDRS
jgi:signal transduction histidine kinase